MTRTTADEQATEPSDSEDPAGERPASGATAGRDDAAAEAREIAEPEPGTSAGAHGTVEPGTASAAARGIDPGESRARTENRTDGPRERRRRLLRIGDPVRAAGVALVVAAAACAAYFGWSWYDAAHDEALRFSRTRDAVLRAAEQGVQNLNTLDYRKVGEGFARWEASSTGDLHDQLVKGRAQFEAQVRQARTVTTARILEGAVTELDARAGKAGVIVALQITVTPPNGRPTTKPSRMRAQLTRTPSGWKLSALGQAPVGTTGNTG